MLGGTLNFSPTPAWLLLKCSHMVYWKPTSSPLMATSWCS